MKKNKFKKLSVLFVALCSIIMAGCANITYSHTTFSSGRIEEQLIVKLDTTSEKYSKLWMGFNTNNLLGIIKNDLDNNFLKDVHDFKNHVSTNNNLTEEEKNYINDSILASTDIVTYENKVVSTISFNRYDVYLIYKKHLTTLSKNENQKYSELEINKTLFLDYYTQYKNDFFKENIKKYGANTITLLINEYGNFSDTIAVQKLSNVFNVSDLEFVEVWAYPNTKAASNASETLIVNDLKYHLWKLNNPLSPIINANANENLSLQVISINHMSWYVVAVVVALIVAIVVFIAALFKKDDVYKVKINYNN